jgi:rhodanese-related sulfurtransferase
MNRLSTRTLRDKLARGEPVVIVDVRSAQEFLAGHVDGAVNMPSDQLSVQVTATSLAENNC